MTVIAGLLWLYPVSIALFALAAATTLDCFQLSTDGIQVGPLNVYPYDIACLVLLVAGAVVALRRARRLDSGSWPALALFSLAIFNFVRGTSEFGLKSAGNGARSLICLIAPAVAAVLVGSTLRINPSRLSKWLIAVGCALTTIAALRWVGVLPIPELLDTAEDFREVPRALPAEYAILVGQALLGMVYVQLSRGVTAWGLCVLGLLSTTTVALQHRSVWVATLVGMLWFLVRTMTLSKKAWLQLGAAASVGFAVLIAFGGSESSGRLISLVESNVEETRQEDSTWSWRVQGFTEAADRVIAADVAEILLGPPAGRDLDPVSEASVQIHDRYVDTLAYYGIAGVITLLLWFFCVGKKIGDWTRRGYKQGYQGRVDSAFLQALLLSQLTYFVPYSGGMLQGTVTALIWLAASVNPVVEQGEVPAQNEHWGV